MPSPSLLLLAVAVVVGLGRSSRGAKAPPPPASGGHVAELPALLHGAGVEALQAVAFKSAPPRCQLKPGARADGGPIVLQQHAGVVIPPSYGRRQQQHGSLRALYNSNYNATASYQVSLAVFVSNENALTDDNLDVFFTPDSSSQPFTYLGIAQESIPVRAQSGREQLPTSYHSVKRCAPWVFFFRCRHARALASAVAAIFLGHRRL